MTVQGTLATALPAANEDTYARIFRRLIPFLLFCYICSYLDRINVGFAKLQMVKELGFSDTAYGLGAGIFFAGYFLFEVPSNIIMLKTGARFWIGRIMITWGVISGAMMFVHSETMFYVLRFLLGLAEAGFIPGVLYYLNTWFPAQAKGRATGMFMSGIPLAGMIGAPLSGWIMSGLNGAYGMSGWQWVFLVESIPSLIAGVACFFWLDDRPETAKWLNAEEKATIAAAHKAENAQKQFHNKMDGFAKKNVWLLSALYYTFMMGLYAIGFWLPSIIATSGVTDPATLGLLTSIPYGTAFLTILVVGRNSDKRRERRWHLTVPAVIGAIGLAASVLVAHNVALAMVALTIATAGILTCVPQFYVIPPMIFSGGAVAVSLAVINSVGNVAGFVSPYLIGYIKDSTGSTTIGVLIVAAFLLVGGACVQLIPRQSVNR